MADERSRIIIEVGLDPAEYAKKATEVASSIDKLKAEQAALRKEGQQNTLEYAKNQRQLQELNRVMKGYTTLTEESGDSMNGYRAQLSLLTTARNKMSEADREGTEEGRSLEAQVASLVDKLKEQESVVGDNRRNVGNYKSAIGDLEGQLGSLILEFNKMTDAQKKSEMGEKLQKEIEGTTTAITDMKKELKEAEEAQRAAAAATKENTQATIDLKNVNQQLNKTLEDLLGQFIPYSTQILAMTRGTQASTAAIKTKITALKALKVALASTGIGAIILLIGSFISYLKRTQTGLDFTSKAMAAFGAIVDVVGDRLAKFGDAVIKLFKGDLTGAVESFKDSFRGIGTEIMNEARMAYGIEGELIKVRRAQEALTLERSRSRAEIERLKMLSDDVTRSDTQRAEAARKAYELEQGLLSKQIDLKEKELKLTEKRNNMRTRTDEQIRQEQELEIELNDIRADSFGKQTELNNRINSLNQERLNKAKENAERLKQVEQERIDSIIRMNQLLMTSRQKEADDLKRHFDELIKLNRNNAALALQLSKEYNAQMDALNKRFHEEDLITFRDNLREIEDLQIAGIQNQERRELEQLRVSRERRLTQQDETISALKKRIDAGEQGLNDVYESALKVRQALESDYDRQRLDLMKKQQTDREELRKEELQKANDHALELFEAEILNAQDPASRLIAERAYLDALYEMQIEQAMLAGEQTTLIKAQYEAEKRALEKETLDLAMQQANQFFEGIKAGFSENTKAHRVAADIQMRANAALQLQNNILIIQEQIRAIAAQGKLTFPANLIAITSTLAALGSGIAAARKLVMPFTNSNTSGVPGYDGGGVFVSDGKGTVLPGYSKKDNVNAKLRSGEGVVVSEAMRTPWARNIVSAINSNFGGRDFSVPSGRTFQMGGVFDGGANQAAVTQRSTSMVEMERVISNAVRSTPPPVVSVRDIVNVSGKVRVTDSTQTI